MIEKKKVSVEEAFAFSEEQASKVCGFACECQSSDCNCCDGDCCTNY